MNFPKNTDRPRWRDLLKKHAPVQLPAAHDALTAKLIERAGFHAYQIGGFALVGARHALPDVDLTRFAEQAAGVRDILAACRLPVLVDADDGYGDVKNVTHTHTKPWEWRQSLSRIRSLRSAVGTWAGSESYLAM